MAPRMTLQTVLVLQVLLHDPAQELYGLEIAELTDLAPGTVYPILLRLQSIGWVQDRLEEIDPHVEKRPPRRYYQITLDGATQASEAIAAAQRSKRRGWRLAPLPKEG
jgi:PadR family transcriptional regulator PadR